MFAGVFCLLEEIGFGSPTPESPDRPFEESDWADRGEDRRNRIGETGLSPIRELAWVLGLIELDEADPGLT